MTSPILQSAALAAALCSAPLAIAQDAPVAAGGEEATAVEAPKETNAKTRAFLQSAADAIYMPERHGLESLSFDTILPGPQGPVATLHCTWTKDGGTAVKAELHLEGIPAEQHAAMQTQAAGIEQAGHEYVTLQLNTVLENNLEAMVANLRGVEEGLIAVEWTAKPDAGLPPVEQTFFFDDEGMWVRTDSVVSMQGMTFPNKEQLTWEAVDGLDEYVQAQLTSELETPFATITQTTTFKREMIHGFNLVRSLKLSADTPMGKQEQELAFENLVVNGKPAPAAAAVEEPSEG